ncbi:MAG: hypothetical protein M1541_20365 [Acidobacteria bacterium]|nr:hypothetical protein [Acidobacteriota bacterium]
MRLILRTSAFLFLMSLGPLFGQSMALVGSGYTAPASIRVSPGQILKIFVSDTKTVLPPQSRLQRAASVPLPKTLAGFSVSIRQGDNVYAVPLLAVEQTPVCTDAGASSSDCYRTALTIQVPFEITVSQPGQMAPQLPGDLVVNDNGTASKHFAITAVVDNIHVVTACDAAGFNPSTGDGAWMDVTTFFNPACPPAVTHADGTLVTADSPAKPAETIIVYAFGLGQTTPVVKTGEPTPTPAPVLGPPSPFFVRTVGLVFDFRVNAGPSRPYVNPAVARPIGLPAPEFVGLTPGQVGLYQINVKLPGTFPAVDPCTAFSAITTSPGTLSNAAVSNLTISMGGVSSFDGAAICVQP